MAIVAHFTCVQDMGPHGEMHVDVDGYMGLADVGDGVTNVALVVPTRTARGIGGAPGPFLDRWIAARPHLAARFRAAHRTSRVMTTGPFAVRARCACARGAALVGDAADFFDPFTGEGIFAALRGAELLSEEVRASALSSDAALDAALARYDRARVATFGGKWRVERLVGVAVSVPWMMNRAARALTRRADLADLLVGVCGDFVPAREVLHPRFLLPLIREALRPAPLPSMRQASTPI